MSWARTVPIILFAVMLAGCSTSERQASGDTAAAIGDTGGNLSQSPPARSAMAVKLTSPAFAPNGAIPAKYTCEGNDTSPPLEWSDVPAGTKSFVLIVDDPDAPDPAKPQRTYVHWVVYNIPANATALPENATKSGLPSGALQGFNDFKKQAYGGPCPPIGRHRYFFKLYALDSDLTFGSTPAKADLLKAMQGHVVGNVELIGTYEKAKK
jgi:Raf kinase inhibitor-like YbhB/YbcL family protein